jgi:single-stranded DNA-binding protein
MSNASAVIAVGTIEQIRAYVAKSGTPLCAMQLSVTSLRRADGGEIERLDTLTVVTEGEQAENCWEFLRPGRSVGAEAVLIGRPVGGKAVGRASAVYFIGRDSAASPLESAKEEAEAAEAAPAA